MPKYQVSRFQKIAPISPARTTGSDTALGKTIPVAIVVATAVDKIPPMTFRMAARTSAEFIVIARVDTDIAIAFAAS